MWYGDAVTTIRYAAIRCDGCGAESLKVRAMRNDSGAAGMRRALRKRGWRRKAGYYPYGKDYCERCAPNHPEEAK